MHTFYKQNGYIEFSTAEKMLIKNPKTYLTKELGDDAFAVDEALANVFASSAPLGDDALAVDEALAVANVALDIANVLRKAMLPCNLAVDRAELSRGPTCRRRPAASRRAP